MNNDDKLPPDTSAAGILQCLRMLADEAASLRLMRTLVALREAIETCAAERADPGFEAELAETYGRVLH